MKLQLSDRAVVIAIAAAFLVIVAALLLQPMHKLPDSGYEPGTQNITLENITERFDEISTGLSGVQEQEPDVQETEDSTNCTPLGDLSIIMPIDTTYLVVRNNNPTYIESEFAGVNSGLVIYETRIDGNINGMDVSANASYTYGLDGKCKSVSFELPGSYGSSGQNTLACAGYPLWVVCSELISNQSYAGSTSTMMRGVNYSIDIYESNESTVWVGRDLPILFKYSVQGENDKSIHVELLDVRG